MDTYYILLNGCHADTEFEIELTEPEAALVDRLAAVSKKASTYSCMPTMGIQKKKVTKED